MSTRPGLARGGRRIRSLVLELERRDGPACGRCGRLVDTTLSGLEPAGPTLGHVIAWANGGGDELPNLRLEHRSCNLAAGASGSHRIAPPRATIAIPIRES